MLKYEKKNCKAFLFRISMYLCRRLLIKKNSYMDTKKLSELKGSEKLKIQAAVLELMEEKGFSLDKDFGIIESHEDSNRWVMAFQNKACAFEDLESIRQRLGAKFKVQITSKSKENFLFCIEAAGEEFVKLGQRLKPLGQPQLTETRSTSSEIPSRNMFDHGNSQK